MKLYCVRHGEALPAPIDAERPLSDQGRSDVQGLARHLKDCGLHVHEIMHSDRLRAVETATLLAETLKPDELTQCDNGLDGLDSVEYMVDQINTWSDDTMLVGHLPMMSRLVSALVMHNADYPMVNFAPGSIVCLDQVDPGRWIVNWLLRPRILPCVRASDHPEGMFD